MGGDIWLDPTEDEAAVSQGTFILSCIPALGTITSVWQNGQIQLADAISVRVVSPCCIPPDRVLQAMDMCQDRCTDIHSVIAQALREYTST